MAERVGFEPTVGLHPRLISSQVHSTTLPPLLRSDRRGRGSQPVGSRMIRFPLVSDNPCGSLAAIHDCGPAPEEMFVCALPSPFHENTRMSTIAAPVSYGELIDKLTILEIKSERIDDSAKRANVRVEQDLLNATWSAHPASRTDITEERARLRAVNEALWDIEDRIRVKEKDKAFDEEFISLARSVYIRNDERALVKREINQKLGSTLVEEKSYKDYR